MRCKICDFSHSTQSEFNSSIPEEIEEKQHRRVLWNNGEPICTKCVDEIQDALQEFGWHDEDEERDESTISGQEPDRTLESLVHPEDGG